MRFNTRRRAMLVVLSLALLGAACGGDKEVGSDKLLSFEDEVQERLGEQTATPAPTPPPAGQAQATAAPKAAAPTQAPATTKPRATIEIAIQSDSAGAAFEPVVAQVFVGSIARWTNRDTVSRSVEADDGTFASGPIAPGASFSYTTTKPGKINYHDGTRPYAVASLEVLAER